MANNPPDFGLWAAGQQAAQKYGVDPDLVHAVISQESSYRPDAVSPKGATGLMQLMPGTAKDLGVDPKDPRQNIDGGVRYLAQLSKQFGGDRNKVLAAYNAGPGRVARGGDLPAETQAYVAKLGTQPNALPDFAEWAKGQQGDSAQAEVPEKSLSGFASNLVNSGGRFVGGLANAVMHPVDTVKGLGEAVMHPIDSAKAVGHYANERYGGLDKILNTLYEDPVGAAADVASVAEPAAWGTKLAGLDGLSKVASTIGKVNPLNAVTKPAQSFAEMSYARNLAPTASLQTKAGMSAREFARLGLDEGINPSAKGVSKIESLQNDLIANRNATIKRASDAGVTSDPRQLTTDLADWVQNKKGLGIQPTPEAALTTTTDFLDEFMRTHGHGPIPLDVVEALKEGAYKAQPESAFVQPPTAARRAVQTKFADMLKHEVEQGTAGFENGGMSVHDQNAKYGQFKNLKDAILAESKRGPNSLAGLLEILGGGALGHPIATFLGAEAAKSPQMAQVLYRTPAAGRAAIVPIALQRALSDGGYTGK